MFNLSVQNTNGNSLELTNNPVYAIIGITGLNPAAATINSATIGANDGEIFNSSRVNKRNIVITIRLIRDVESARINLYTYFRTKQPVRLFYSNDTRNVYIDGRVETMECDFFARDEVVQISVVCLNPFFRNIEESVSEMSLVTPAFEFPFDIPAEGIEFSQQHDASEAIVYNHGDIVSGMKIELYATGAVVNPVITNTETLDRFDLNYSMLANDKIVIDTIKGEKSVTLTRYGTNINLINAIGQNPSWLQLALGENTFTYSADSGENNLAVTIRHTDLYEGV